MGFKIGSRVIDGVNCKECYLIPFSAVTQRIEIHDPHGHQQSMMSVVLRDKGAVDASSQCNVPHLQPIECLSPQFGDKALLNQFPN